MVVLYLLDEVSRGIRALGGASRWWLHHSLEALGRDIPLTLRTGAAADVLPALVRETGATAVFWNRRYGAARDVDAALKEHLRAADVEVQSFQANLLFEPWTVRNGQGEPYRVFTPFWRAAREFDVRDPLPAPRATSTTSARRRRSSTTGTCCPPGRTGPTACARPGRPASTRPTSASSAFVERRSAALPPPR